jgi:hypothetical protein
MFRYALAGLIATARADDGADRYAHCAADCRARADGSDYGADD